MQGTVYVIQSLLVGLMSICFLLYSSWGRGQTFIIVLEGQQHDCLLYPRKHWARKQLLTNPSLCMQYRNTHLSGFALGIRASILHTNLGNWSITVFSLWLNLWISDACMHCSFYHLAYFSWYANRWSLKQITSFACPNHMLPIVFDIYFSNFSRRTH